ncbi:Acyl transferase/acyl hydrolase/lysophospholipase [Penicillium antarcticum]|uniref:Acyl transferase/acyl hydrolase/lysophospholipase n=1 Tax=Penicillium antarcticum TaxID=416450 RepID=UPI002393E2DD|nr:Acyl transferase/acyl hydrolase/lysophospholipase [Penicillium antarcticum]KAJ5297689.1 Acyl transferase/acyl hydrolase/lysophospholipase [Penicillium antarcticum]
MATLTADANGTNEHVSNVNGSKIPNDTTIDRTICKEALSIGSCLPKSPSPEPIAICGMSVRLPGGLHSPQQFWDFLVAKGDALGPIPKSRYNASAYYSEEPKPGSIQIMNGYFLDESIDLATMDTSFFTMGASEVEKADPYHRQMLEVARECMEDAGEIWKGRRIGCFMGSFGQDWSEIQAKEDQQHGMHRLTGTGDFMLANRVSYEMDLSGPSVVIRTACSASLVALHEACLAISRGDCEGAIVGGANLILTPTMTIAMSEEGVLSPDGSCKTFSADANGYARGEAVSAIFIRPLADAIRHGNPVRAVIRATASNSDGKGTASGIQVPNGAIHEALIRHAYDIAGITDYSETALVECHGTGTQVGDPIEATAVGRVFGPSGGVHIGSVKPNLGHAEGASGLTSLIKSVLALENRIIPPNIKFTKPNPKIGWDTYGLSVPTEPTPWPAAKRERISVNGFGIGGTNAHVILESAKSFGLSPVLKRPIAEPQLLVYSANTAQSLKNMKTAYETYIQKNPERVSDLAFTLSNKREHLPHRAYSVVNTFGAATTSTSSNAGKPPNIVMVFTGQGAQWPEMGRFMIESSTYPVFNQSIEYLDEYLRTLALAPKWTIKGELQKKSEASRLNSAEFSQPLCTAIQIALVDSFTSVGIQPTAVVGHSSGEVAAAYAAKAITAQEAITIAFYRGQITKLQTRPGAMAAIGMGTAEIKQYLQLGVRVACENSPQSVTLAGDTDVIESIVANIQETRPDVLTRKLQVDKAYHSHHMSEISDEYHALIEHGVSANDPKKLFFSTVEGKLLTPTSSLGPKYWKQNLESPVLFHSAISSILNHEIAANMVFLEVGPHSALAGPLRQIQAQHSTTCPYTSALRRKQNDVESFLAAIGDLHVLNADINFKRVIENGSILPDLPRYPWDHSRKFWYESRLSKEWRHREHTHHELLGLRVLESPEHEVLFRNVLHLNNVSWICDHKVGDDIVFPFAGYAGMAGEAVRQITGVNESFKLRNVLVSTALVINSGQSVEIVTALRRNRLTDSLDSEWWDFSISSHNGTSWKKHCSGEARSHIGDFGLAEERASLVRKVNTRRCYKAMAKSGLNFGPSFKLLEDVRSDTITQNATSEVLAKEADSKDYHLHPTVIDASLQMITVAASKGYCDPITKMVLPTKIGEICISRCFGNVQVRTAAHYTPNGSIIGSGQSVAANGKIVMSISGTRLSALDDQSSDEGSDGFARTEWGPHIDFLDANTLIKPSIDLSDSMPMLTQLTKMCMVYTKRIITGLDTPIHHMHKYRSWIDRQLQSVDLQDLEALENHAIEQRVQNSVEVLSQTELAEAAVAVHKVFRNVNKIFIGDVEALDILVSDDTLSNLYVAMDHSDQSQFLRRLAHSKPNLRVLEIGAGTGGTTTKILRELMPGDKALYSKYTYTDISSGFFVAARERFGAYPNIDYATFDVTKDPIEQGFDGNKYDLVVAANIIHATKSLNESLSNVKKLLAHNGRLLLTELCTASKWSNYIWGTLPGWWYGEADDREDEPYISPDRWAKELEAAGFRAPDAIVLDSPEPYQMSGVLVARPAVEQPPRKIVTLLTYSGSKCAGPILQRLESRGYTVHCCGLQDMHIPIEQNVIALLEDEGPFFEDMNDERFGSFQALIEGLKNCGIFWITGLSQIQCQDPRFGQINGIARTIRSEMLIDFATCEVDNVSSSLDKIIDVFECFQLRQEDEMLKPEFEYAIVDNTVHVGRIYPFSVQGQLLTSGSSDGVHLRTRRPGHLSALHWAYQEIGAPSDDEVEVEIYATGLNFKDVLCAMGIIETTESNFGLEGAGIVRRTGSHNSDLKVGDRVMVLSPNGCGTRLIVSEKNCEKIPKCLSFEDAATMPTVFTTSIYSVFEIGNLKKGQSILIHSACGGVGIATIQLAQMVGADVYATVDSMLNAFRYMQQGVHLGKIVMSIRNAAGQVLAENVQPRNKPAQLDSLGVYLLVGGLGGLGRAISTWMVNRGARHLIFLSRSAGASETHQEFAQELASMRCRADFVKGSVSNIDDVNKAVAQAQGRLKGILQMSMVLSDQAFTRMTMNEWNTAVNPKVKGTWNLHNASVSVNADLDFFVLFSSISGIFGQPGQTNYAGANTFMDAFAQYRLNQGLPACAIGIGAVEEVGYAAEQNLKNLVTVSETVSPRELLQAIELAVTSTSGRSQSTALSSFCVGIHAPNVSLSNPKNRSIYRKDVRMAVFHNTGGSAPASDSSSSNYLKSFMSAAKVDASLLHEPKSIHLLAVEIGKKVFSLLLKPEEDLHTSCSLSDLGMDSLVAIEVRQWWRATFEFDISVLEMMSLNTLDALGKHAAKGLLTLCHGGQELH